MSQLHSQMARFQMRNSIRSLRRPTNMPRWRHRFGPGQTRRMPQSLSTRRRKTPLFKEVESRPGQVSWRSWQGHELQSILDAVVWLRMPWVCQRGRDTDTKCHRWPTPVEPLGLRGAVGTPGVFDRAGGPQVGFWRTPCIKQIRLHVHRFLAIVCLLDKKKSWSWCSLLYDCNPVVGLRRIILWRDTPFVEEEERRFCLATHDLFCDTIRDPDLECALTWWIYRSYFPLSYFPLPLPRRGGLNAINSQYLFSGQLTPWNNRLPGGYIYIDISPIEKYWSPEGWRGGGPSSGLL